MFGFIVLKIGGGMGYNAGEKESNNHTFKSGVFQAEESLHFF